MHTIGMLILLLAVAVQSSEYLRDASFDNVVLKDKHVWVVAFKTDRLFASVEHILVDTKEECQGVWDLLNAGNTQFADAAKQYSKCPSGQSSGGDLGTVSPGKMVKAFDNVVFHRQIGSVHGPVQTEFGWHLIHIKKRIEVDEFNFEFQKFNASLKTVKTGVVSLDNNDGVALAKRLGILDKKTGEGPIPCVVLFATAGTSAPTVRDMLWKVHTYVPLPTGHSTTIIYLPAYPLEGGRRRPSDLAQVAPQVPEAEAGGADQGRGDGPV